MPRLSDKVMRRGCCKVHKYIGDNKAQRQQGINIGA